MFNLDLKQKIISMDIDEGIEITYHNSRKKILVNRTYTNRFVLKIFNVDDEYIKYINSVCDVLKFINNNGKIKKIHCY